MVARNVTTVHSRTPLNMALGDQAKASASMCHGRSRHDHSACLCSSWRGDVRPGKGERQHAPWTLAA